MAKTQRHEGYEIFRAPPGAFGGYDGVYTSDWGSNYTIRNGQLTGSCPLGAFAGTASVNGTVLAGGVITGTATIIAEYLSNGTFAITSGNITWDESHKPPAYEITWSTVDVTDHAWGGPPFFGS